MDVQQDHVIHLENGRFAAGSSRAALDRIVGAALAAAPTGGLAVHFHGGLVNEAAAREIAERLAPIYATAGQAYPLFFAWESGVWETIWNNLDAIRAEPFFQALTKKVAEWVIKKLPDQVVVKGAAGTQIDERELRTQFDAWFAGTRSAPPELATRRAPTVSRGVVLDEKHLAEQIEVALDTPFKTTVEEVFNGLQAQGAEPPATRGAGTRASVRSLVSPEAADELFARSPQATRGLLSWGRVALFVTRAVVRSIDRLASGRGHGLYPTVVEEVLRAAYGDKIGRLLWESMKTDTADAFTPGPDSGGFALLDALAAARAAGTPLPKITLIGHSTGAIFICHFLDAAAAQLPGQQFDVVFLAPAATHELFAQTLNAHRSAIAHFRQFGMEDARECQDRMAGVLYPRSLLYFVSGLLEPDVDMPLVGMQRYLNENSIFTPPSYPAVAAVAEWLGQQPHALVWSVADAGPGLRSAATRHGDFDNDTATLDSLAHVLAAGF